MSISIVRGIARNYDTALFMLLLFCLFFATCHSTRPQPQKAEATVYTPAGYERFDSMLDVTGARQDSFNRAFDIALARAKADRVPAIYQAHQAPRDTFNTRIRVTRVSPRFGEEQRK